MKTLMSALWLVWIVGTGIANATPLCKDYWEARKTGQDWQRHPLLSQYDDVCASNLVVAKDWVGNCGVHVTASGHYPSMHAEKTSSTQISWFPCNIAATELSFGDYVEGTTEVQCVTRCERCATGPYVQCSQIFKPKAK